MRNIKLGETGRRLTKYPCYICFYDFSAIQGPFLGTISKVLGLSNITHVSPLIEMTNGDQIEITVCQARKENGRYLPTTKIHKHEALLKKGAILVDRVYVGQVTMDINEVMLWANDYTDVRPWDLIFYHLFGRFLGLTRPRACTSLVCKLFDMKEAWHPATLYRRFKP